MSAARHALGLDASTAAVAVCALHADGRAAERLPGVEDLLRRPAHARELMPALAGVLEEAELAWSDLDLIAVGRGPGSFTGIRVALATARGLADAHGTRLVGVGSLTALAEGVRTQAGEAGVLALIDARRGEVFAALHAGGTERWAPEALAPEALAARLATLPAPPLAVGDGALRHRAVLEAAGARVPPEGSPLHAVRGLSVCHLALDGPVGPAAPLYLRDPDARPMA